MTSYDFDFQGKNGKRLRGKGWFGQIALWLHYLRWPIIGFVGERLLSFLQALWS